MLNTFVKTIILVMGLVTSLSLLAVAGVYKLPVPSPNNTPSELPSPSVPDDYTVPEPLSLTVGNVSGIAQKAMEIEPSWTQEDFKWLRLNLYFEDRQNGMKSMLAIGLVTMNRVNDPRYDDSVKEVVTQAVVRDGIPVRNRCHFSWYCNGLPDNPTLDNPAERKAWEQAGEAARQILMGEVEDFTDGALYYHADYVNPHWSNEQYVTRVATVGDHIYYTRNN